MFKLKDLREVCLKVFKSANLPYEVINGRLYLPFVSDDDIPTAVLVETQTETRIKQISLEIRWATGQFIPFYRLNTVLEFIEKVNATKKFSRLRLNFDEKTTLSVVANNLFGENLDDADIIILMLTFGAMQLFNACSPSFVEILKNNIDAETAFQKFKKLEVKYSEVKY